MTIRDLVRALMEHDAQFGDVPVRLTWEGQIFDLDADRLFYSMNQKALVIDGNCNDPPMAQPNDRPQSLR